MASLLSVNVGLPQTVDANGRQVLTSIFKHPVSGRIAVRKHQVEGDRQADLRVHGGPYKAVYSYPSEHYAFWREKLGVEELPYGSFGENLTTEGLLESAVQIGDTFQIGSVVLQVTQPRMPCFKLSLRFARPDMVKLFWQSDRPGIYFSVLTEGDLAAGDTIGQLSAWPDSVTVGEVVQLYKGESWSAELRDRALRSPLRGSWKTEIQSHLSEQA